MMLMIRAAAVALSLTLLSACGGGETDTSQPNADEQRKLDNAAARVQELTETIDTSPDSAVPVDGLPESTVGNGAAPAAPIAANNSTTANAVTPP